MPLSSTYTNCKIHVDPNRPDDDPYIVKKHNQQALEDEYPEESRKRAPKELKDLDGE